MENKQEIRIYVACLVAYNQGHLHGKWIDANQDPYDIWGEVRDMLAVSPVEDAEEWAIHDYEGFGDIRIEEYTSFDTVAEIAAFLTEHGALGAALADHLGNCLTEAKRALTDQYLGSYDRLSDYLAELTEQTVSIPQSLVYYIDYDAMARDAELSGDVFSLRVDGDLHVFAGG